MRELNRTIRLLEQWADALDVVVCQGFGGPLRREAERLRRAVERHEKEWRP